MSRKEIRIAGFGGQGIVLSGYIIGKAASIYDKGFATLTQSYGPESRGGSCRAEVIISDVPVDYPYMVNPQVQVILSQEAYDKYRQEAPSNSLTIIDSGLVKIDSSHNPLPLSISASSMAQGIGRVIVANIVMLGFLAANSDIVSREALRKSILDSIPQGTENLNMEAFEMGYKYGVEHGSQA